uniref:Beta-hexosaminidase n=1 Tax=Panagrellus redivivus TaxID=6233 RepID=A0A7E4V349_PANRE
MNIVCLVFIFFVFLPIQCYSLTVSSRGEVWPLPQQVTWFNASRGLRGKDGIVFNPVEPTTWENCQILQDVYKHYISKKYIYSYGIGKEFVAQPEILKVNIKINKPCPGDDVYPQQGMNEQYFLTVRNDEDARIEADEIWGVIRGIETLSQLIYVEDGYYYIKAVTIYDYPRFPVRGFLLDTGRHFLAPSVIMRQIDLAAQNKLNLFHWHIVDNEAFPYTSDVFPNLSIGAFSPRHRYSKSNIQEILKFARMLGIRVMIEFDTPGHVASWKGQPGFLAKCKPGAIPSIMNPTIDDNYKFLTELLKEVVSLFPEKYLFLGGDESVFWYNDCWKFDPEIVAYMKKYNFNVTALEALHVSKVSHIVDEISKEHTRLYWQDSFIKYNPDDKAVIGVWTPHAGKKWQPVMKQIAQKGHKVVLYACWYLNYIAYRDDWIKPGKNGQGDFETPWYDCDPHEFGATEEEKTLVLGGVASMWGELVDGANVEDRLWPRASAVAERLWSDKASTSSSEAARPRLLEHTCRMIGRGFRAQPANGASFCPVDVGMAL